MSKIVYLLIVSVIGVVVVVGSISLGFFAYSSHWELWIKPGENLFEWKYWKYVCFVFLVVYALIAYLFRPKSTTFDSAQQLKPKDKN